MGRLISILERVKAFGEGLKGRLNAELVDYALSFAGHGEDVLSLETLCDCVGEYEVVLAAEEYAELLRLVSDLGLELSGRYT